MILHAPPLPSQGVFIVKSSKFSYNGVTSHENDGYGGAIATTMSSRVVLTTVHSPTIL